VSRGDDTKQRIVAEAAGLFNQRGFEGGSVSALMEATGLEKGGIYRHFSSKEEIAAEAFDYALNIATEARIRDLDTFPNSVDKLKLFIANFVDRRSSVPGGCPILNTAVDADDGNPVLRDRARKAFRQWLGRLESIVKAGIKAREIRRGVDPRSVATLIVSSLEGALVISRLEKDREALLSIRAFLEAYLERDVRRS
jgi:TetR/AcrR family transcriptional regulator, transcriptional repressor for nem operon